MYKNVKFTECQDAFVDQVKDYINQQEIQLQREYGEDVRFTQKDLARYVGIDEARVSGLLKKQHGVYKIELTANYLAPFLARGVVVMAELPYASGEPEKKDQFIKLAHLLQNLPLQEKIHRALEKGFPLEELIDGYLQATKDHKEE